MGKKAIMRYFPKTSFIATQVKILLVFTIIFVACKSESPTSPGNATGITEAKIVKPQIVHTLPHDAGSFTQGLLWKSGFLYESSGRYGQSTFRKVDVQTGDVLFSTPLDQNFFGEGLALKNDRFVQLTWREHSAFVYDTTTFARVDTLSYSGEGWGLTNDDQFFIMSNGSGTLAFRDDQFNVIRTVDVTLNGEPVSQLNELEFANGLVYANIWFKKDIYEISPETGQVQRIIDCSELVDIENPANSNAVLNGIAYHPATEHFFITGKNWSHLFEVKIEN